MVQRKRDEKDSERGGPILGGKRRGGYEEEDVSEISRSLIVLDWANKEGR